MPRRISGIMKFYWVPTFWLVPSGDITKMVVKSHDICQPSF